MTSEIFGETIEQWLAMTPLVEDADCDIDRLLAEAYELASNEFNSPPREDTSLVPAPPTNCVRFAQPKSDDEILCAREKGIPENTKNVTKYCLSVWEEWRKQRQARCSMEIAPLSEMTNTQLSIWLSRLRQGREMALFTPLTPSTIL